MDTTLERPALHSAPVLEGQFSRDVCVFCVFELLWLPEASVYKLHIVESFKIPYWRWYFWIGVGSAQWNNMTGFCTVSCIMIMMKCFFPCCRFWREMVSCIQITLQHQSVSGFFDASLSSFQVRSSFPQIWMFPPLYQSNSTWKRSS